MILRKNSLCNVLRFLVLSVGVAALLALFAGCATVQQGAGARSDIILRGSYNGEVSGYYAGAGEGEFSGRWEEQEDRLLVWGSEGNLIARGSIGADGETEGVWRYVEGGGFSAGTPIADYPSADGTENSWSGERSL